MSGKDYKVDSIETNIETKRSPIHGIGVFTKREYPPNSYVAFFEGYEIDHDTRYSLSLDGHKIEPTGPLKYLNHSCDPNAYFEGRTLKTIRRVERGEELTINYLDSEDSISYPFECNCCTAQCKKNIKHKLYS